MSQSFAQRSEASVDDCHILPPNVYDVPRSPASVPMSPANVPISPANVPIDEQRVDFTGSYQAALDASCSLLDQISEIMRQGGLSAKSHQRLVDQISAIKESIQIPNEQRRQSPRAVGTRSSVERVPVTYSLPFKPLTNRRQSSAAFKLALQVPAFVTQCPPNDVDVDLLPLTPWPWHELAKRVGREWDIDMFQVHQQTKSHSLIAVGECALSPVVLSQLSRHFPPRPFSPPSDDVEESPPPRLRRLTASGSDDIRDPFLFRELELRADASLCHPVTLRNLLSRLEANYVDVPHHSSIHAAQVTHHVLCLTKRLKFWGLYPRAERVALLVAALGHDVGHCARTNKFLQHTSHRLTVVYNDQHVFENFHSAMLFTILEDPQCNVFQKCIQGEWDRVRRLIIAAIISTDLQDHFEVVGRVRDRRLSSAFDPSSLASDRRELSCIILKTADLSYLTLPWDLAQMWTSRVYEEFWSQGDEETLLGLPVSPLCNRADRDSPKFWTDNASFCSSIVLPLLVELSELHNTITAAECESPNDSSSIDLTPKIEIEIKNQNNSSLASSVIVTENFRPRRRSVCLPISSSEAKLLLENREFRKIANRKFPNDQTSVPATAGVKLMNSRSFGSSMPTPSTRTTTSHQAISLVTDRHQSYLDVLLGMHTAPGVRGGGSSVVGPTSEILRLTDRDSSTECLEDYYEDCLTNDDDISIVDDGFGKSSDWDKFAGLGQFNSNCSNFRHNRKSANDAETSRTNGDDNCPVEGVPNSGLIGTLPFAVFCCERLRQTVKNCIARRK